VEFAVAEPELAAVGASLLNQFGVGLLLERVMHMRWENPSTPQMPPVRRAWRVSGTGSG